MVHKIHGSRMYEVRTLHKKVMRHQGQVRPRFEKAEVDDHTPRSEDEYREAVMRQFADTTSLQGDSRRELTGPAVAG